MADTVKQLEKIVHALFRKVLNIEKEITQIKQVKATSEAGEILSL